MQVPAASTPTRARVLVVEDSEAIRVSVATAFTAAGYQVRAEPDGGELEELLAGFRPDLVVLDLMLPGRDGLVLMAIAKARTDAGVILLTARDTVDDRLRGLNQGADDYVVKPFALAELIARAAVCCAGSAGSRAWCKWPTSWWMPAPARHCAPAGRWT
jgi:DNA-binding response OmpR family regulator